MLINRLSKTQLSTILGILLLVTLAIWGWEYTERENKYIEKEQSYIKMREKVNVLKEEVKDLSEQNKMLIKVLKIKQENK